MQCNNHNKQDIILILFMTTTFTQHQVQYLQSIICYDTKWPQVACHNATPQQGWAIASLETVFTPDTTDNTWASPLVMKPRGAERISSILNSVRQWKRRALIKAEVPLWEIHTWAKNSGDDILLNLSKTTNTGLTQGVWSPLERLWKGLTSFLVFRI